MKRRYFGTDGIRGQSNVFPMTPDLAMRVGIAVGTIFRRGTHRNRVVIGKDTRLSGYMLENAMVAGFTAAGVDAFVLGPIPTPAVAMLTRSLRADIGVMISASHNPFQDNGIKLFGPDGYKLSDETGNADRGAAGKRRRAAACQGRRDRPGEAHRRCSGPLYRICQAHPAARRDAAWPEGRDRLRKRRGLSRGAGALWELGADVVTIGADPNGTNINLDCGSTHPEALRRKVDEVRADIGIALDGDADRVQIVDENGRLIDGDQMMAVIAEAWAAERHAEGRRRWSRPSCPTSGLSAFSKGKKIDLHRTQVGDRYVVEHMRAARLQCRRRAVRPYRPFRFRHDRRRACRGAAGAGLRQAQRQAGQRGLQTASSRCRRS